MRTKKNINNQDIKSIINKIIKLCPEIKEKKKFLIATLTENDRSTSDDNKLDQKKEIIVEELVIDGVIYYKDCINNILNDKAQIIGYWATSQPIFYKDVGKITPTLDFSLYS